MADYSIRASSERDLLPVAEFLKPFVDRQQILPRTHDEISVLLEHGFVADVDGQIAGFAAVAWLLLR